MKFLRLITHPLNMPAVSRVRRNHALEHATMHVLSERRGNQVLVGRSSIWGFRVYGRVPMEDVAAAAQVARARGLKVVGLTGETGGRLAPLCDVCIQVPALETARVQEYHLPIYHTLCLMLEDEFFG